MTGPAKIDQVGTKNLTTFLIFVALQLKVCARHYNKIFVYNEIFYKQHFETYRMQISYTEPNIFNILWLGVFCANLDHFCWAGHIFAIRSHIWLASVCCSCVARTLALKYRANLSIKFIHVSSFLSWHYYLLDITVSPSCTWYVKFQAVFDSHY